MTKRNPISVPDGYFQSLEQRLQRIPMETVKQEQAPVTVVRRLAPYFAYAASLLVLVAVGTLLFRSPAATDDESWDYVSYLAQSLDPDGLVEIRETEPLTDEDIRSYLLASNLSVEQLIQASDEEDF